MVRAAVLGIPSAFGALVCSAVDCTGAAFPEAAAAGGGRTGPPALRGGQGAPDAGGVVVEPQCGGGGRACRARADCPPALASGGMEAGESLSCTGIAVGLLGGEVALGMVGYVAAFELTRAGLSRAERVRGMLPALTVRMCVPALITLAGYGAHGTNAYLSPLDRPLTFARVVPDNFLAMAAMQFLQAQRELISPGTASMAGGSAVGGVPSALAPASP